VDPEINKLKSEVAVLLAFNRTRLDKTRWASIQQLLHDSVNRNGPPPGLHGKLLRERDYLQEIIEEARRREAAIMSRRLL
jgi:hypothetical protein